MNTNAKYRSSGLHLVAIARWLTAASFLGAAGLSYVYLTNQLNDSGKQRKALEQNLRELMVQNNVLEAQIFRLTSHAALQRRLDDGVLKLVPISTQSIVHVRPQESARWAATSDNQESQYRTISQDGFVRR